MNTYIKNIIILITFILFSNAYGSSNITLNKININVEDKNSLQRGAKVFF